MILKLNSTRGRGKTRFGKVVLWIAWVLPRIDGVRKGFLEISFIVGQRRATHIQSSMAYLTYCTQRMILLLLLLLPLRPHSIFFVEDLIRSLTELGQRPTVLDIILPQISSGR